MLVSPQNSYAEILTSKGTVLGGRALGRWLGPKGGAIMNGISTLTKQAGENFLIPFQRKVSLEWGSRLSQDTKSGSALMLEPSAAITVRNKRLLILTHRFMIFCYGSPNRLESRFLWNSYFANTNSCQLALIWWWGLPSPRQHPSNDHPLDLQIIPLTYAQYKSISV